MEKIRLDLDALTVDSFPTHEAEAAAMDRTVAPAYTCDYTCGSRIVNVLPSG